MIGQGGQRFLQGKIDVADGVGLQLVGIGFGQRVDVQLVDDALDLGLHPAVAVQRPVDAAGHQRLVVEPGDGGGDVARGLEGAPGASSQSPRETSTSRSSTMPALWPAGTFLGWRAWFSTWATVAVWPLGSTLTLLARLDAPVATRPQNTRRPWLVSADAENFSTHCTGKAKCLVRLLRR